MKQLFLLIFLLVMACDNKRLVELPEISKAEVSEVLDVSPAYVFYDESEKDSVLFNRKNIIGTTNWLVTIDKRLTLRQALPHIQYLQNKRRKKGMHTNEKARNYFTCHDLSKQTLGFLDFTNTYFHLDDMPNEAIEEPLWKLFVYTPDKIELMRPNKSTLQVTTEGMAATLLENLNNSDEQQLFLIFNYNLSFQDYIRVKEVLLELINQRNLKISDEFFLNLKSLN